MKKVISKSEAINLLEKLATDIFLNDEVRKQLSEISVCIESEDSIPLWGATQEEIKWINSDLTNKLNFTTGTFNYV